MHKVRVGVLRGGDYGYDTSLKTGEIVVKHLPDTYYTEDIVVTPAGEWVREGSPVSPHHVLAHLDVVFNALHGPYAQNKYVQHILETHRVPFTGAGTIATTVGMNNAIARDILKRNNLKIPHYKLIEIPNDGPGENLVSLFRTYSPPMVIRPVTPGAALRVVKTYAEFVDALEQAFIEADSVILEEFIMGVPASVGVIDHYRDKRDYSLPAHSTHYLTPEQKEILEASARLAHEALGMRHYSQTDFVVHPRRGVFVTGISPLPHFHEESTFHHGLSKVGAPLSHFLDHVVQLAISKK